VTTVVFAARYKRTYLLNYLLTFSHCDLQPNYCIFFHTPDRSQTACKFLLKNMCHIK